MAIIEYQVDVKSQDGMTSTYRRVQFVLRDGYFLEIGLLERSVFINLKDVVSYSVRKLDATQQVAPTTIEDAKARLRPKSPTAVTADNYPKPPGGESA